MYSGSPTDKFQPMLTIQVPSLANGLISAGGLTYTFPIRKGVRFHDGSVMTVDDVVYSIRRFMLQDPAGGPAWLLLSTLLGVDSTRDDKGKIQVNFADVAKAVSAKDDAIVFRLKRPFAPFLSIIAAWTSVMPRAPGQPRTAIGTAVRNPGDVPFLLQYLAQRSSLDKIHYQIMAVVFHKEIAHAWDTGVI